MPDEEVQVPPKTEENLSTAEGTKMKERRRKKPLPEEPTTPMSSETVTEADRKARRTALFPASSFEEALVIPNAIQKHAAGQQVRRLTLFDQLGKSPDSGPSRQLITMPTNTGFLKVTTPPSTLS